MDDAILTLAEGCSRLVHVEILSNNITDLAIEYLTGFFFFFFLFLFFFFSSS